MPRYTLPSYMEAIKETEDYKKLAKIDKNLAAEGAKEIYRYMVEKRLDRAKKLCYPVGDSHPHSWPNNKNAENGEANFIDDQENKLIFFASGFLDQEASSVEKTYAELDKLYHKAQEGKLRAKLENKTVPETDYVPPTVARRREAPSDTDKAICWAIKESINAQPEGNERPAWAGEGLEEILESYGTKLFIPTAEPLIVLWTDSVGQPRSRRLGLPTNYPSNVGGMYILRKFIAQASRLAPPANGDPVWYDYALFWHSVVYRSQSFPDGNKRMARAVYAIVCARGKVPFRAPTKELRSSLAPIQ